MIGMCLYLLVALGQGAVSEPVPGFTAPYRSVTLSAPMTGVVERVPFAEGALVEAGAELVGLRDRVQRAETDLARARAKSDVAVKVVEVRLERAHAELERLTTLRGDALASVKELADAQAEARLQELNRLQALEEAALAALDLQLQEARLAQHSLEAPFAGYVSNRQVEIGQTAEAGTPLLDLVQLDPLLVVLECPLEQAQALQVGVALPVRSSMPDGAVRTGKVQFVSPVANPASQTVRVKLEVPNPRRDWLAGMKTYVQIPVAGQTLTRGQE